MKRFRYFPGAALCIALFLLQVSCNSAQTETTPAVADTPDTAGEGKNDYGDATLPLVSKATEWAGGTYDALVNAGAGTEATEWQADDNFIDSSLGYLCGQSVNSATGEVSKGKFKFKKNEKMNAAGDKMSRLQLGGTGIAGRKNCLQFIVSGPGTVTVLGRSSGDDARCVMFAIGRTPVLEGGFQVPGKSGDASYVQYEMQTAPGDTVNVYSLENAINIYSLKWTPQGAGEDPDSGGGESESDPEPGQNGDQPGGARVGDVPLDALYGYGGKVTGGTGADASHIFYFTSGKALQTWLLARQKAKDATPAMVYLMGTFHSDEGRSFSSDHPWFDVKDTKNISFIGLDGFTMDQIGLFCVRAGNIVIRNVYIKMPKASNGADGISMQSCDGVWVDHCTFESLNQTSDYEDGSCDITHASTNVTVSWCKFIKTQKSCLVGHSSSASADVAIKATFHHNWFSQSSSRHPRVRYGTCHVYNNLFDGCTTYGVGSACGAMVLVEHNVFDAVALPTDIATFPGKCVKGTWKSNLTDKQAGYLYAADNDYVNRPAQDANIQYDMYPMTNTQYTTYGGTATTDYQYSDFQPPYSYTVDATAGLRTILETGTGTKKLGFGTYPAGAIKNAGITEFDGTDDSGEEPGGDDPDDTDNPGGGDNPGSGDDASAHTYKIYYDGGVVQTRDSVTGASYFTSSESKADFSKDYSASSYTVEGVSYSYGLKFDSKGYVTFTTSADYDSSLRFYFTARKTGTTAKIQLIDADAAADAEPVAAFSAEWGTVCGSGEVALGRSKTYTLKQKSTEQGLIVAIVTEKQ